MLFSLRDSFIDNRYDLIMHYAELFNYQMALPFKMDLIDFIKCASWELLHRDLCELSQNEQIEVISSILEKISTAGYLEVIDFLEIISNNIDNLRMTLVPKRLTTVSVESTNESQILKIRDADSHELYNIESLRVVLLL